LHKAVVEAEQVHGSLRRPVFLVTDNGPSFVAHRFRRLLSEVRIGATGVGAFSQVRIGHRMPTQLGLLERFHDPPKGSRWVGWLQKDQETAIQSSNRMLENVSA